MFLTPIRIAAIDDTAIRLINPIVRQVGSGTAAAGMRKGIFSIRDANIANQNATGTSTINVQFFGNTAATIKTIIAKTIQAAGAGKIAAKGENAGRSCWIGPIISPLID